MVVIKFVGLGCFNPLNLPCSHHKFRKCTAVQGNHEFRMKETLFGPVSIE